MRRLVLFVLSFWLLVAAQPVLAQQRVSRSAAVWPELQLEYVFKSTSFLYFRNQYRHALDHDFNHLREKPVLRSLEWVQFRLGYEHILNRSWAGGLATCYAFTRNRNILFTEIFARHSGPVGKFRFSQRAAFEHLMRWPRDTNGRFRLRLDLDRSFPIGQVNLRPRAVFEAFHNVYYQDRHPAFPTRWVNRSRFRFDCQMTFNSHVAINPYFMRQTDYLIVEPAYDANGQVLRPGGKQNHISPVWGVELRYSFFEGGQPFSRAFPDKTK